ncbi:MAG: right-handed parallel beta-helix repeat-containing protein [Anaerolineales bacterium]|nr:right-handed parallel beta-helix repeat-containing protein [Anaerolineales bacterium]
MAILLLLLLAAGCDGKGGGLVVNSTGDSGDSDPGDEICRIAASATECTLRAAIEEANAWAGTNTITFNLPAGSLTIAPLSALPEIREAVILDGMSQPGYVRGTTLVTLDGGGLLVPPTLDGLTVAADIAVTMKGLAIVEFPDSGISNRGELILEEMNVSRNRDVGLATGSGATPWPVTIVDSEFTDNVSAGISSNMNAVTITGGIIRGNGGGIGVSNGSLTMRGTEVRDNIGWALHPFGGVGLYLSHAELTGVIIDNNSAHDCGGGIDFTSDGSHSLIVNESTLSNNIAYLGGGLAVNGGTVRLNHSVLIDNKARIDGGGVHIVPGSAGTATLWVENGTEIGQPGHGNTAEYETGDIPFGRGGGIYSEARVEVSNSVIEGNSGDGIYNNNGWLRLQTSVVRGNTMNGIASHSSLTPGTVQISGSTIEGNTLSGIYAEYADLYFIGGLIRDNSEGGLQMDRGDLDLSYSTISGNIHLTDARTGGGIGLRSMGDVVIQNSTISGNSATSNGGGLYIQARSGVVKNVTISGNRSANTGGGMVAAGDAVTLNNVTITQNSADHSGGILGDNRLTVRNSIIAENTPINCAAPDPIVSGGFNLDDGTTCGFTAVGDLSDTSPKLGPLQDNGGSSFTHALAPDSPAIDAGDDATCLPLDQRNVARPQGPHCDIGAFEAVSEDATPTPTPTPALDITPTPTPGLSPILFDPVEFSSDELFQGGKTCHPMSLTVKVMVAPADLVHSIALHYRLVEKDGTGAYDWNEGLKMERLGNGWYQLELSGNDLPSIYNWQNEAWLDIQFVAYDSNYQPVARSEVFRQVTLQRCMR